MMKILTYNNNYSMEMCEYEAPVGLCVMISDLQKELFVYSLMLDS